MLVAFAWLVTLPWGNHYPELWLTAPSFVDTQSKWWCVAWLACAWIIVANVGKRHVNDQQDAQRKRILLDRYNTGLVVLYERLMAVVLGFKGVVELATVSWLAYCAIGALLIAHCVKARH